MNPKPPSADELVRRVLEALAQRTLAFVYGRPVPVRARSLNQGVPLATDGLRLSLTTLAGAQPALWLLPTVTWKAWAEAWGETRVLTAPENEKALMMVLTGGLDQWQLMAGGERSLPAYPFPTFCTEDDVEGLERTPAGSRWFEVRTPTHLAWLTLAPEIVATGSRLQAEPEFRSLVKENVLGEACGRLGAERPWQPSVRGALKLGGDFAMGPCLLPELVVEGTRRMPRFHEASGDSHSLEDGEPFALHQCGWGGHKFGVLYRATDTADPEAQLALLAQQAGRLATFAGLLHKTPGPEAWQIVHTLPGHSQGWLRIRADHGETGPFWDILLPSELLNALSADGTTPALLKWLWQGADNLLQVFFCANDRLRRGPPRNRGRLDGWRNVGPPPPMLLLSDLFGSAPPEDQRRLVQNLLAVETKLHPLGALFGWVEDDPTRGTVSFCSPGFEPYQFRDLLPLLLQQDWDRFEVVSQSYDEYRERNRQALELLWNACRGGRLGLSSPTVAHIKRGFVEVRQAWRLRAVQEGTGEGLSASLNLLRTSSQLATVLQRDGARALALVLYADPLSRAMVAELTATGFAAEVEAQTNYWHQQFGEEGPDYDAFFAARESLVSSLRHLMKRLVDEQESTG